MLALEEYAQLVRQLAPEEEACGAACATNRAFVEAAWQVRATYYSSTAGCARSGTDSCVLGVLPKPQGVPPWLQCSFCKREFFFYLGHRGCDSFGFRLLPPRRKWSVVAQGDSVEGKGVFTHIEAIAR